MTCKPIDMPHVTPGWGCCNCAKAGKVEGAVGVYNSNERSVCKLCGHQRCDTAVQEQTASSFVAEHPEVLAVVRPADAKLALKETDRVLKLQKRRDAGDKSVTQKAIDEAYQGILALQEYTFLGLLDPKPKKGKTPRYLDPMTGKPLGTCKPGDSFVPYAALCAAHTEGGVA